MNRDPAERPVDSRPTTEAKEFQAWWDRLPTKGKHAVIKRQERRAQRAQAREKLRVAASPAFICPRCHTPHPTAAVRKACRESHRSAA